MSHSLRGYSPLCSGHVVSGLGKQRGLNVVVRKLHPLEQ